MRKMISGLLELLVYGIGLTCIRDASDGRVTNEFLAVCIAFIGVAVLTTKLVEHFYYMILDRINESGGKKIPLKLLELVLFTVIFFVAFYMIQSVSGFYCSVEILLILSVAMTIYHLLMAKIFDSVTSLREERNAFLSIFRMVSEDLDDGLDDDIGDIDDDIDDDMDDHR